MGSTGDNPSSPGGHSLEGGLSSFLCPTIICRHFKLSFSLHKNGNNYSSHQEQHIDWSTPIPPMEIVPEIASLSNTTASGACCSLQFSESSTTHFSFSFKKLTWTETLPEGSKQPRELKLKLSPSSPWLAADICHVKVFILQLSSMTLDILQEQPAFASLPCST